MRKYKVINRLIADVYANILLNVKKKNFKVLFS